MSAVPDDRELGVLEAKAAAWDRLDLALSAHLGDAAAVQSLGGRVSVVEVLQAATDARTQLAEDLGELDVTCRHCGTQHWRAPEDLCEHARVEFDAVDRLLEAILAPIEHLPVPSIRAPVNNAVRRAR